MYNAALFQYVNLIFLPEILIDHFFQQKKKRREPWLTVYAANVQSVKKTSMMWPSHNFLLYNRNIIKMKVTEWINNLKKYVNPPPLGIYTTCTNYNNLISKKSKRF